MTVQTLITPKIYIAGFDITNHVTSVSLDLKTAPVDTTAFGQLAKTYIGGIQDNSLKLEIQNDWAASSVEATLFPLQGSNVPFSIQPVAGATSSTNPVYSGTVLISDWLPVGSTKPGDLVVVSVTYNISGVVTKSTT